MSLAEKAVIGTVAVRALVGMVKASTVGLTVSGKSMVTEAEELAETRPVAPFAQAYKVLAPSLVKVYEVGGAVLQPEAPGEGGAELSVRR